MGAPRAVAVLSSLCAVGAVLAERLMFFRAAAAPRMPGGVPT
jgi:hypothetical protein